MGKVGTMVACLLGAVVLGGAYGAMHGVLSYAVAPGYFHDLRFPALGIAPGTGDVFDAMWAGLRRHAPSGLAVGAVLVVAAWPTPRPGHAAAAFVAALLGVALAAAVGTLGGLLVSVVLDETGVARGARLNGGSLLLGVLGTLGAAALTARGAFAALRAERAAAVERRLASR